jgi:S-adenosylmethionine hydrolase
MLPLPKIEPPLVEGEVFWVDWFGNVQTNMGPEELAMAGAQPGDEIEVRIGSSWRDARYAKTFADAEVGELLVHVDSAGLLALAVRAGRADVELGLQAGMAVAFRVPA